MSIPEMSGEVRFVLCFLDDVWIGDKMPYLGFVHDLYFFHRSGELVQINETAYEVISIRQVLRPQIG